MNFFPITTAIPLDTIGLHDNKLASLLGLEDVWLGLLLHLGRARGRRKPRLTEAIHGAAQKPLSLPNNFLLMICLADGTLSPGVCVWSDIG